MLNINIILFSRTITNDYRWIYWDKSLKAEETNTILNDYREFELNRDFFINNPHLVMRQLGQKIAIYHFSETSSVDQNSRKIFALQGCVFSGIDFEIAKVFLPYISAYLFYNRLSIYTDSILDNTVNAVNLEKISIDSVVSEYKSNNNNFTLTQKISTFIQQYPDSNFIITNGQIEPIKEIVCFSEIDSPKAAGTQVKGSPTPVANSPDLVYPPHKKSHISNMDDILNGVKDNSVQPDIKKDDKSQCSCLDTIHSFIKGTFFKGHTNNY